MSSRHIRGPMVLRNTTVQTAAGNVTVTNESQVIVKKDSSEATTVALPAAAALLVGQTVFVKDGKGDAASYPITVDPDSSGTIDGQSTYVIREAYGAAQFTWNGTEWNAIASSPASAGAGAAAGTGVVAYEQGSGVVHKTILALTDVAVALTDNAGVVAYGGLKVYDFPQGAILVLGAVADLDLTKSSAGVNADWDGDFGLGTVTASNNNTLSSTEQDILPTTATPQAVAGVTTANGQNTAVAFLDGTATAKDCFLNVLVDDTDHNVAGTACNLIFNGTITLHWVNMGDY